MHVEEQREVGMGSAGSPPCPPSLSYFLDRKLFPPLLCLRPGTTSCFIRALFSKRSLNKSVFPFRLLHFTRSS